jgi:hypothetical protein
MEISVLVQTDGTKPSNEVALLEMSVTVKMNAD